MLPARGGQVGKNPPPPPPPPPLGPGGDSRKAFEAPLDSCRKVRTRSTSDGGECAPTTLVTVKTVPQPERFARSAAKTGDAGESGGIVATMPEML
jgi:hypothetical protein